MEDVVTDSYGSLSDSQPLQQIAVLVDEVSTKEKFKLLCKLTYKIRQVKTKGALLVLAWNFLAAIVFWFLVDLLVNSVESLKRASISIVPLVITLPLVGWLADACIGRYRAIYCSSLVLWATLLFGTISKIIKESINDYRKINTLIEEALFCLTNIALGGLLSTTMSFGMDQLYDASTIEVSAFIVWYVWTFTAPCFIQNLISYYMVQNKQYFILFGHFLSCTSLTLIVISLFCCSNWLIKEPISQNPFKLIYRVTKYAIKNKYPQNRSAFTYCEDEVISRIDYGKSKYGGPFTTEQVEDVKTFYRTLPIIIHFGISTGEVFTAFFLASFLKFQFVWPNGSEPKQWTMDMIISYIIPYCTPVLIVLNEVLIYPIFYKCCLCLTSVHKFIAGEVILVATFLALMTFDILSRQSYLQIDGNNATISCVFYQDQILAHKFSYNWIMVPDFLYASSITLMVIGCLEFVSAQVPYSMRGVIFGVGFCSIITTSVLITVVSLPFQQKRSIWGTGIISCGFWYALVHIVLCIIGCIVSVIITKKYKNRKREDVLPNEQIFAERYYSVQ